MTVRSMCALVVGMLAGVSAASAGTQSNKAHEGMVTRSDLEIVECLLPAQVRQLGNMTYLGPRRPTRTTTADCRVRGGEYVAYDRADTKSALRIWLASAIRRFKSGPYTSATKLCRTGGPGGTSATLIRAPLRSATD